MTKPRLDCHACHLSGRWWAGVAALGYAILCTIAVPRARAADDPQKQRCLAAYGQAQELRIKGSLMAAREHLLTCSQDVCPKPIVHDCVEWLADVETSLSSIVFAVSDAAGHDIAATRVRANGRELSDHADGRALTLDPGTYNFRFEAAGYEPLERAITMRQSEKNRIVRVQLVKQSDDMSQPGSLERAPAAAVSDAGGFRVPTASIVLGATAVVSVASFAFFGLSGKAKRADADGCMANCSHFIDEGKRDYVIADISLGVAVLSAGSAVLVALLNQEHASRSRVPLSTSEFGWSDHGTRLRLTF